VAEAVGRLRAWDFSAPTGIPQGYDAGDDPDKLPEPSAKEIQSSVSATIYSVWRSRIVDNVIDGTLRRVGVGNFRPGNGTLMTALRHWLENFNVHRGRGASGVNFFEVKEAPSPEVARDIIILRSVKEALDLLASDGFGPAFKKSTNQNDYRWGRLHRALLDHRLGARFNIPEAGGFSHLSPDLRGIARPGGFESLDGSAHSVRATGSNGFMHTAGAASRFVGELRPDGPRAFQIIAGGQSGDARSKFYANMLGRWLTNQYHPMLLTRKQVNSDAISEQRFFPAR
jgi:penicillin amidase